MYNKIKIALACDHAGYRLKQTVAAHLAERGYETVDFGANSEDSCDYPDYAAPACKAVVDGECRFGILICGTGIGMSIAANKIKGIRAAVCTEPFSASLTRLHNDANVLCLGQRVTGEGLALDIVDAFLAGDFEGGKHLRRINKIAELE
jgi:ribose 5-phosphate isomerase B